MTSRSLSQSLSRSSVGLKDVYVLGSIKGGDGLALAPIGGEAGQYGGVIGVCQDPAAAKSVLVSGANTPSEPNPNRGRPSSLAATASSRRKQVSAPSNNIPRPSKASVDGYWRWRKIIGAWRMTETRERVRAYNADATAPPTGPGGSLGPVASSHRARCLRTRGG